MIARKKNSIQDDASDLVGSFEGLDDWESKYSHIMDLGKRLLPLKNEDKHEANIVHGCQSQVWLIVLEQTDDNQDVILSFNADSDALIVKGLVSMAVELYSGHSPAQILEFDFEKFLGQLGLQGSLSMTRSKGLLSVVKKIRQAAKDSLPKLH